MNLKRLKSWLTAAKLNCAVGALLTVFVGVLFFSPVGQALHWYSYDLAFSLRAPIKVSEVVLVAMDEASYTALGQDTRKPWDRRLHAQLVDRLKAEGAKLIVFDLFFRETNSLPEDQALAAAMRSFGRVVLGSQVDEVAKGVKREFRPILQFATNALDIGDVGWDQDADFAVRRHLACTEEGSFSLAWVTAQALGVKITQDPHAAADERWINYYGPAGTIPSQPYHQVLTGQGIPAGLFSNKVVFIGQNLKTGRAFELKDNFRTVFSRFGDPATAGTEIHATVFLNLQRGDWYNRLPDWITWLLILIGGGVLGAGLAAARPKLAGALAAGAVVLLALAVWLLFRAHLWFPWAIVLVQIGVACGYSLFSNSLLLYIEKRLLRDSLERHIPPARVQQLLKNPALLKPDAEEQEISVVFSDIADFSRLSEQVSSKELFEILNNYYETALTCIHRHDGLMLQLIGDAIHAVWNAPLPQADHRERACLAALDMHNQLVRFDAGKKGVVLHTRVGIHSGIASVGNLGSKRRFQYTAIGENVNLASRLEGLNKYLGTFVLATRVSQSAVESKLVTRCVGWFRFKGFLKPTEVYELVGQGAELEASTRAWRAAFSKAWVLWSEKKWDDAEQHFHEVIRLKRQAAQLSDKTLATEKPGHTQLISVPQAADSVTDGPAEFYLRKIAEYRANPPKKDRFWEMDMEK